MIPALAVALYLLAVAAVTGAGWWFLARDPGGRARPFREPEVHHDEYREVMPHGPELRPDNRSTGTRLRVTGRPGQPGDNGRQRAGLAGRGTLRLPSVAALPPVTGWDAYVKATSPWEDREPFANWESDTWVGALQAVTP